MTGKRAEHRVTRVQTTEHLPEQAPSLDVRLFGRVRVLRDGCESPPLARQPAAVLALLALHGGVVHRDHLVQALWPDEGSDVGRARLRNVLSKLRQTTGASVQERNESVTLHDTVRCDFTEFVRLASRAVSGVDDREDSYRASLAAQALWVGSPLEEFRYSTWAENPRARAFELQARLWKLLPAPEAKRITPGVTVPYPG